MYIRIEGIDQDGVDFGGYERYRYILRDGVESEDMEHIRYIVDVNGNEKRFEGRWRSSACFRRRDIAFH